MKLTEERIKDMILEEIQVSVDYTVSASDAAAAIYSAHEQEVKEYKEAFEEQFDLAQKFMRFDYENAAKIESLEKENAQLKASQKDFDEEIIRLGGKYRAAKNLLYAIYDAYGDHFLPQVNQKIAQIVGEDLKINP